MIRPEEILSFWLDDVGPEKWYAKNDDLDAEIRDRFYPTWTEALEGACGLWLTAPASSLAYIILTDQFPRNMFRGSAEAFATDKSSRAAAKVAIGRDWDLSIAEPARHFFYMPLMHSENLIDQDRCIRLICSRLSDQSANNLLHARVHREIIRDYGRFPYRNEALGRSSSDAEQSFLDGAGYAQILNSLKETADAA